MPCPASLFTSQPQEHGHAGLAKPQTPGTIESLATKLRGGGIDTTFHRRGRVKSMPACPTSSPGPFLTGLPGTSPVLGQLAKPTSTHLTHSIGRVEL
jgi:hypothetical protein